MRASAVSIRLWSAIAALTALPMVPTAADKKQIAYGEHLSRECTTCHRRDGVDNGIPSITGWDAADFIATMDFYKSGARNNPAMVSVASSLEEDQIQALAAFFATLAKPARK